MLTAEYLNAHLKEGGFVQITTYHKSTVYEPKHAGMFQDRGGDLHVQRGKSWDCLSCNGRPLVGIRIARNDK